MDHLEEKALLSMTGLLQVCAKTEKNLKTHNQTRESSIPSRLYSVNTGSHSLQGGSKQTNKIAPPWVKIARGYELDLCTRPAFPQKHS